jgi:hypothetical protein
MQFFAPKVALFVNGLEKLVLEFHITNKKKCLKYFLVCGFSSSLKLMIFKYLPSNPSFIVVFNNSLGVM